LGIILIIYYRQHWSRILFKLVRHYQEIAGKEGLPIWWEAGTEHCWKLYKRLGFVTVDEITVAKGKAGADGNAHVGGEGVRIWGMMWRPECANAGNWALKHCSKLLSSSLE
jgi:hypothetical protein